MRNDGRIACIFLVSIVAMSACHLQAQGTKKPIRIAVDLREAPKRIFHSRMEFPVSAGPLTLVYPKWIPGEHGPNGPIVDVTGVHFRAGGKEIAWRRDDVDMYAFNCDVPAGADSLEVTLDFLSPSSAQGFSTSPTATSQIAVLNWNLVLLYPSGPKSDDLIYQASVRLPAEWKFGTALPIGKQSADEIDFEPASLTTLVDSTVLAGAFMRTYDLAPGQRPEHRLHIASDSGAATVLSPEQLRSLRQLVAETGALFGARHYRRYDFLLALSDNLTAFGEEHHESSDNRGPERTLLDPYLFYIQTDLLPHEFFHSWNGKYRRPAGLATPDYQKPVKGDLLWVYEGLTNYYGTILSARIGLWTPEQLREDVAWTAAYLDQRQGRTWRNLQDTAIAAQILYDARPEGASWRRSVDFYDESTLIWLEADAVIRRETRGKRSLDDFCRRFHGGEDTPPKVVPYTFEDVVAGLNEIAPYDWRTFFTERLNGHGPGAPLGGLQASGWRLTYNETMNEHERAAEAASRRADAQFSLGLILHNHGKEENDEIEDVIPGSPAAEAGIAPAMRLVAVNGRRETPEILREAIREAKTSSKAIELLVENEGYFRNYRIAYHGGERYPHLERVASQQDVLSEIARPKAPAVAAEKD